MSSHEFNIRARKRHEQEVTMDKSHVSMEQHACLVCTKAFDTGNVLLDTRVVNGQLRQSLDRHTVTGWGLCPEHKRMYDDGFIALVGCDPAKTEVKPDRSVSPSGAYRTGRLAHIKASVFSRVFDAPHMTADGKVIPVMFVDDAVLTKLAQITGKPQEQTSEAPANG